MGIEDKIICLCLNKRWQPIGVKSVRDAFSELVHPNCVALNVIYKKNKDGSLDFSAFSLKPGIVVSLSSLSFCSPAIIYK